MKAFTLRLFSASVAIAGLVAAGSAQAQTSTRPAAAPLQTPRPAATTVATPVAPAATTPAPAGATGDYTIGIDDVLHVIVWDNKELEQDVIVRPDGKISYPLAGEIHVQGLTVPKLTEILKERLGASVKNPNGPNAPSRSAPLPWVSAQCTSAPAERSSSSAHAIASARSSLSSASRKQSTCRASSWPSD